MNVLPGVRFTLCKFLLKINGNKPLRDYLTGPDGKGSVKKLFHSLKKALFVRVRVWFKIWGFA